MDEFKDELWWVMAKYFLWVMPLNYLAVLQIHFSSGLDNIYTVAQISQTSFAGVNAT